ncbi:unnamed protein product [Polarella glacialis]|uniref:BTB domain-containing protein n=1 Tax=Polarella glacialis TaxID=89957 RepID=A0A813M7Z2_POLGL|nr:unnamed protein product [Polarella glacialis]CAE8743249.1 unnamed protein product [Polarella glacialis]
MVEVQGLESVYERLYAAEESKDVEIQMLDGSIRAHSIVLSANSDAITGMLTHGAASTEKTLRWNDHPVVVGRFVLRLMYTGTVDPDDWPDLQGDSSEQIPLQLLLGGLAVAKVYMVTHLLAAFSQTLQSRLSDGTFNEICAGAIRYDVTALRLHCLQFVQDSEKLSGSVSVSRCGLEHLHGKYVPKGRINGKTKYSHEQNAMYAIWFSEKGEWQMLSNTAIIYKVTSPADVPPLTGWLPTTVMYSPAPLIEHRLGSDGFKARYIAKAFAPEVMSELAAVFGPAEAERKRRKTLA